MININWQIIIVEDSDSGADLSILIVFMFIGTISGRIETN